jgi:hypothetical protein|tara:strand:- start:1203 stop:1478 length:276 start_codon:yes stop_codon:yes gene_type:complete
MEFKNIKFTKTSQGVQGIYIKNGYTFSVVGGLGAYSLPRKNLKSADDYAKFELAVFNSKGWATRKIVTDAEDDVVGWLSRTQITEIINNLK